MDYSIDELHKTLVEILDFVVDICETNNFSYCLLYGTALGAFRHNGFIPWDDDLDIGMPREDYEKLKQYFINNRSDKYILQNNSNEKKWFLTFSKVRKNNTIFIESMSDKLYGNNGVYIDVFPLDYVDKKDRVFNIKRKKINHLKHVLKIKSCPSLYLKKRGYLKYIVDKILCFPFILFKNDILLTMLDKQMISKLKLEDSTYIAQYDESSEASVMEKDIYFPFSKCVFEGKEYNVPNKIEEYLRRQYGDGFMELPPLENRITHEPIKVKL